MTQSWVDLVRDCPLDLERIHSYNKEVESYLPEKIVKQNLNRCKENVLRARGYLDSMFNTLIQMLYNSDILKKSEDKIIFMWLTEDIARYLGKLDEEEAHLIIKFDNPNSDRDMVGVSRISTYAKKVQTSKDIIYESLLKATKEYKSSKDGNKDERTFLYILFQVLMVTMAISGGLQRVQGKITKRNSLSMFPSNYQTLMSKKGSEIIKQGFEEDTGMKVSDFEENLGGLYDEFEDK